MSNAVYVVHVIPTQYESFEIAFDSDLAWLHGESHELSHEMNLIHFMRQVDSY